MAPCVAGQVHRLDFCAATEVKHVAVGEALSVGPGRVVELVEDERRERVTGFTGQPVDLHEPVDTLRSAQVGFVDVETRVSKEPVAAHVVFVAVGVNDGIDWDRCPSPGHDGCRRVDQHGLTGATYEQRVPRGVSPVVLADQHADRVGQLSFSVAPVSDHGSKTTTWSIAVGQSACSVGWLEVE